MVIESDWITKLLGVRGIILWPFIIVKRGYSDTLLNHELIHLAQCHELFVVGFYVLYILSFIIAWVRHRSYDLSYKDNWFEKEAFDNQNDMCYLEHRTPYAWVKV